MKQVENSNQFGKLDERRLWNFEKRIGARLPEDYRGFLMEHNGGKPVPSDFSISTEQWTSLHHVLGLHDGHSYLSLEGDYEDYLSRMPASIIPIADDSFGNAICIGISGTEAGKVYFWDHELEGAEDEQPYFGNITLIADSFTKFLESLFEWVDPNETEILKALKKDDVARLKSLLPENADLEEEDQYGRTVIENAACANATNVIQYLYGRGAKLRNALKFAEKNAEFFEEHKRSVKLIKLLRKKA